MGSTSTPLVVALLPLPLLPALQARSLTDRWPHPPFPLLLSANWPTVSPKTMRTACLRSVMARSRHQPAPQSPRSATDKSRLRLRPRRPLHRLPRSATVKSRPRLRLLLRSPRLVTVRFRHPALVLALLQPQPTAPPLPARP